jgi:hypothetical protein
LGRFGWRLGGMPWKKKIILRRKEWLLVEAVSGYRLVFD